MLSWRSVPNDVWSKAEGVFPLLRQHHDCFVLFALIQWLSTGTEQVKQRVPKGAPRATHLHCILSPRPQSAFYFLPNAQSRLITVPGTLTLQHIGDTLRGQDVEHVLSSLSETFTVFSGL